jgi:hypothetical protein
MSSKEIYVSTDVEADGPIPGPNSMLSFGSAAYTGGKKLIGTFSANLETLPGQNGGPNRPRPGPRAGKNWKCLKRPCAATSSGSKPFPESQYSSATQPDSISYSFTGT